MVAGCLGGAGLVVLYEFPVVRSWYPEVVDSDKHVK